MVPLEVLDRYEPAELVVPGLIYDSQTSLGVERQSTQPPEEFSTIPEFNLRNRLGLHGPHPGADRVGAQVIPLLEFSNPPLELFD